MGVFTTPKCPSSVGGIPFSSGKFFPRQLSFGLGRSLQRQLFSMFFWSNTERHHHINFLELLAAFLAHKFACDLHLLLRLENTTDFA